MPVSERRPQTFQHGAFILLASAVLVKVIGALFKIPLSSEICLGDLGFGYFSSAYDLFLPIYTLAMAGLPVAVARVVAEHSAAGRYNDVRSVFRVTSRLYLVTGFAGFAVMLALTYPFVKLTDPTGNTVYSIAAIAPAMLFCCFMSAYRGYYEGLRNMYPTAVSEVIEAMGKLIFGFGFAYVTMRITGNPAYGAAAAMLGITLGAAAAALYLHIYYKICGDHIGDQLLLQSPAAVNSRDTAKTVVLIAVPVVLASLSNNIASLIDVSMVKWQLSSLMEKHADFLREMYAESIASYNSVSASVLTDSELPTLLYGVRGKAYTLYNLVPTFASVLGVSAVPVLASSWQKKDAAETRRNINSILKMTALIAFPAGIGLMAVGKPIMSLIYTSTASVQIGGPMLRIFGAAALFAGTAVPLSAMLQAVGKQKTVLINVLIGAVVKIAVNYITVSVPQINIMGASCGTLACFAVIAILNFCTLVKYTGIIPDISNIFIKPMISAVICGSVAFGISLFSSGRIVTLIAVFSAAAVYVLFLSVLHTFEESDILSLPKGDKLLKICRKFRIIR